jgi:hypothetical protein
MVRRRFDMIIILFNPRKQHVLSFAIMGHILRYMVKSKVENDMEAEFLMTSNGGLSICDDEELAW